MAASSPAAARRAALVSSIAAAVVAVTALVVLVGWLLDRPDLEAAYGGITMKTNAAIGLLLCAAGLQLQSTQRGRWLAGFCGVAVSLVGALTLGEHLFRVDLGIDQALFKEAAGAAATASPNRMGPNAAASFILLGLAILGLCRATPRGVQWAQRLAIVASVFALFAVAGYLYGATELYAVARYTGIALHTAVSLLLLGVGIVAARIDEGPMAIFTVEGPAGTLVRRLAAPVLLLPLVIGYIALRGREAGLYDRGLLIALLSMSLVVMLGAVVWHTANTIAAADVRRRRAEQLKDQFIAVLSHELRTPLNVMLGWTRVLETESSPERHARAATIVARNGRMLARLVEDLLDLSRVTAGQFEITRRPMQFNAAVQAAVDSLVPRARQKEVSLTNELDPRIDTISGDAERLQQIVSNLVANAIKFTNAGGRVHVKSALVVGGIRLTVQDDGIGFDDSFAADLFRPFRQADSSFKREFGGLGLGLSIAKHIAELHGGTLTGRSEGPGRGALFTLHLPTESTTAALDESEAEEKSLSQEDAKDRAATC